MHAALNSVSASRCSLLAATKTMVHNGRIQPIQQLFYDAAIAKANVPFGDLYGVFPDGTPPSDVYDTLEAACGGLADRADAIYEALLAKRSTGRPGVGFFDQFRNVHPREYDVVTRRNPGNPQKHVGDLSAEEEKQIVDIERPRVYRHAPLRSRP